MANAVAYLGYNRNFGGGQSSNGDYGITLSGSYVNGTGESINLLNASNPNGYELNGQVPMGFTDEPTPRVIVSNIQGYEASLSNYSAGTFTLKLYSAAGTELGSGAYPTPALTGTNAIVVQVPSHL
jgi:hypothetical protein